MEPDMLEQVGKAILELSTDESQAMLRNRLRIMRVLRGMKVADVAPLLGVSRPFLSMFETGQSKLPIERVIQICGVYGVNWIDIVLQPKDSVHLFGVSVDSLLEEPEHAAV
jgi:transcriptional regulator with XRE-family HTH domain